MGCGRSMLFIFGQRREVKNAVRADVFEYPAQMSELIGLKRVLYPTLYCSCS
jgi:hypothetical protein